MKSVIAIDGPAGVGKSVVAARLARALGYTFLDSGAFYRAVTLLALRRGIPLDDGPRLAKLVRQAKIEMVPPTVSDGRLYTVLIDGQDVTWDLFSREVDASVPQVAAHPAVRQAVLPLLRAAARSHVVVAGRDIGTVVLPDADLKVYLDASPESRARRRAQQLQERGQPADYLTVLAEVRRRDQLDRERVASALRPAPDAVIVNTEGMTLDEELELLLGLCRQDDGKR